MSLNPAVIIGASGQVAGALREALAERGVAAVLGSSKGAGGSLPIDLGSPDSIRGFFRSLDGLGIGPAEVFLPGAMTHVDRCEEERDLCRRTNAEGPGIVAEECRARGHRLTFFSTEYVFGEAEYHGGAVGPFAENAAPAAPCWYGQCKLDGERNVLSALPEALVVRTTMVFSWAPEGNNFLMQYWNHLCALRDGKSPPIFRIPEDQVSTPTYAPYLAGATCRLREQGASGIFHLAGTDLLSRRELVERVIDAFGFDRAASLEGFRFLKTRELGQRARRPLTAGLRTEKAGRFGVEPFSLAQAFSDVARLRVR